jgi:predicted enzyme related to lactoylglutathione lyase
MSDLNTEHNRLFWFDIPAADVERAATFYRAVLGIEVHVVPMGEGKLGVLEPVTGIGEHGFRAIVADSEGNRIGLHSPTDA